MNSRDMTFSSSLCARLTLGATLMIVVLPVFADQPNGVLASVFVILGLGGFTLVNLGLQLLFYFNGQYSSERFALGHTLLSLLMPLIAAAMLLADNSSGAYLTLNLGLVIIAAALTLLPLQLKNSAHRSGLHAGWILLGAALLLLLLSASVWPLAILALFISWFAINRQPRQPAFFHVGRALLLLLATAWCLYNLAKLWQWLQGQ
ncbi:hypothetical protein [Shewanella sp. YIC-542]|uniref:hypothetical protein n=1 Tax=Shewanella mytili TaxID=3377111 RepID=UPI00398F550C